MKINKILSFHLVLLPPPQCVFTVHHVNDVALRCAFKSSPLHIVVRWSPASSLSDSEKERKDGQSIL